MSIATSEVQTTEHTAVTPPRWRWYHAVTFYGVIQVLTLGLSGLVSLARGNRSQSLRSPLNALVLTFVMFLLTIASGMVALFRLKDTRVALYLATLFIWLIVALTTATFQALWNRDDLYGVRPNFLHRQRLSRRKPRQHSPLVLPDRRDLALEHGDMLWRRMLSESVCHVHLSPSPRLDKRPPLSGVIRWDSDKKG